MAFCVFGMVDDVTLSNITFAQTPSVRDRAIVSSANDTEPKRLHAAIDCIKTLHQPMGEPQAGDWLATYREQGQTFSEYVAGKPTLPTNRRRVLYVQPLGSFTKSQRKIISLTAQYMELFFGLTVKLEPDKRCPRFLRMRSAFIQVGRQANTVNLSVISCVAATLPADAHALIAFTSSDLYPGAEMKFCVWPSVLE